MYILVSVLCIKKTVTVTNIVVTVQLFKEINILDISEKILSKVNKLVKKETQ